MTRRRLHDIAFACVVLAILFGDPDVWADGGQNHTCQGGFNCNDQTPISTSATASASSEVVVQNQIQHSATTQTGDIATSATGGNARSGDSTAVAGSVTAGDQSTSVQIRSERQVPDGYLLYSPNYIDCGRVIGFQFGNSNGIASGGIPIRRDRSCDHWKAVEEAQQNGHILLSYAFMCQIPNVGKRTLGKERCERVVGLAETWWDSVLGVAPIELGKIEAADDAALLLAQTDVEELERRVQQAEERVEIAEADVEKAAETNELLERRLQRVNEQLKELQRKEETPASWQQELKEYKLRSSKDERSR